MFRGDAPSEIQRLERGLRDAEERFLHAPGGLWLAASATIEGLGRLDPTLLDAGLRARAERLAEEARRMKADGDTRASQHELAALAEWVELARHRAALEEAFLAAVVSAPRPFTSRAELAEAVEADQRALDELALEPADPIAPATQALIERLRAVYPEYDPQALPYELVVARGRAALREVGGGGGHAWSVRPFPSSIALVTAAAVSLAATIASFAYFGELARAAAVFSVSSGLVAAAILLALSLARRRSEMGRRVAVLEAWGFRARTEKAKESAALKHERWVTIARALGHIDAFRRTEAGRSLDAREGRLPALAPWVRTLVGGLDEDHARRYDA